MSQKCFLLDSAIHSCTHLHTDGSKPQAKQSDMAFEQATGTLQDTY